MQSRTDPVHELKVLRSLAWLPKAFPFEEDDWQQEIDGLSQDRFDQLLAPLLAEHAARLSALPRWSRAILLRRRFGFSQH